LKNNDDVVYEVLEKEPELIEWVGDKYKKNKELLIKALQKDASLIRIVEFKSPFKDDYEIANIIVSSKSYMPLFDKLSERLRADKELAQKAVKTNISNFYFVSKDLKEDIELVQFVLENKGEMLKETSTKIKNNKDMVLIAVKNNGLALKFASKKLRKDIDVIKVALENNSAAYTFIPEEALEDENIKKLIPEKYSDLWWDENEISKKIQQVAPTEEMISFVEEKYGYKLPKDYIELMKKHNGGRLKKRYYKYEKNKYVEVDTIFSISDEKVSSSIIQKNECLFDVYDCFKNGIIIASTDNGHQFIMLDYSECKNVEEPKVVCIDNEFEDSKVVIANNFKEFLDNLLFKEEF